MTLIKTWIQEQITLDFHPKIYENLRNKYTDLNDFMIRLKKFANQLIVNRKLSNINPFSDTIQKGIYILGASDSELGVFPDPELALKCSEGQFWAEDLKTQFQRSIELVEQFETRLNSEEKNLLQVCPVYLHFQTSQSDAFFKQIIFMQRVTGGLTLGDTEAGFSPEFCRVFNIPRLAEIHLKPQFALHLYLDSDKHRQLLKIQTVYLFQKLQQKGITIMSLNQKNILVQNISETGQTKYIIIDPSEDFFPPISPLYNTLTSQLCT